MKFYKNGRTIKFKKSKKTIELEPTYYVSDSTNTSIKDSWEYRTRKYKQIEKDQEQEDDLKTLEHSADYLGERMSVSLGALVGLGIINIASFIAYQKLGINALANSGVTFGGVTDLALTTGLLTGFGTLNVKTLAEFTKDSFTFRKLRSIKKEIEQKEFDEEDRIRKAVESEKAKEEAEKYALLHRTENPTKEIEYEKLYFDENEEGKVVKRIEKHITHHSERYEAYKSYVISSGADEKLFELPAINNVIDYVIEYGGPKPIYFKNANEDGTFDICGRMGGPNVEVVFKMEYCDDGNPEHYLLLKKYEQKSHHEGNFLYIDGCVHNKIYINKEGIIVEETEKMMVPEYNESGLLGQLHKKKLIKSMI